MTYAIGFICFAHKQLGYGTVTVDEVIDDFSVFDLEEYYRTSEYIER